MEKHAASSMWPRLPFSMHRCMVEINRICPLCKVDVIDLAAQKGRRKGEIDGQLFSRRWLDGTALKGRWSLHVTLPRVKLFRNDRRSSPSSLEFNTEQTRGKEEEEEEEEEKK